MGKWGNIYTNMEVNKCFGCVASCCKLIIDINRGEYERLNKLKLSESLIKQSEMFIQKNPEYKGKEQFLDGMYNDDFAIIKKGKDGFCSLLNKETRLCGIYENRPKVCIEFSNESKRCKNLMQCIK